MFEGDQVSASNMRTRIHTYAHADIYTYIRGGCEDVFLCLRATRRVPVISRQVYIHIYSSSMRLSICSGAYGALKACRGEHAG